MLFAFGFIAGIVVAALIFTILAFFRAGIEKHFKIVETTLASAGPRPKGYIFEPEDEADIVRAELIAKNKKEGKDTPIKDLL